MSIQQDSGWIKSDEGAWHRTLIFPLSTVLHIPGDDGRLWDASLPVGATWQPAIGRANFLIAEQDDHFTLLTPFETRPVLYSWSLERTETALIAYYKLSLPWSFPGRDDAPLSAWHEQVFATRDAALLAYRTWMIDTFPQPERYRPSWCESIPGCVMLQLWAGTGEIDHTFDDVCDLLDAMHAADVPANTLIYFWGWFAPFDTLYPEYWPASELGGEAGMHRLITKAQDYGYRLMPHANYQGFSDNAPDFAAYASEQVLTASGEKCGWREEGEPAIEYMRSCSEPWRAHHIAKLKKFIDAFPVDVLFWDQYGSLHDDPACDDFSASLTFSGELQAALPQTVIAGEILNEHIRDLPLWQEWGTPWCGLPVQEDIPHSNLLGTLFGPLVAGTFGHMGTPAAVPTPHTWPSYYWYIDYYGQRESVRRAHAWHQSMGAIPSVRVNFRDYGLDPVALAILKGEPLLD